MRICFLRNRIRPGSRRGTSARKASNRKIETAPEKMYRTVFADKAGAKLFEDFIGADQDPPEAVCIFWIIRGMLCVLVERDGLGNLDWHLPDFHLDVE